MSSFVMPLFGGLLIGLAASVLLLLNGRILGVSGIFAGTLIPVHHDTAWRVAALAGFIMAGVILSVVFPDALAVQANGTALRYVIAGLLVGFGTQLGKGCTSGHGVCGISRLSPRSIFATLLFIASGMAMVAVLRLLGVPL